MALKTFVKINSVNNLSDARYCAGMGVDIIGFNINEQAAGSVTKEKFDEITSWVSGPAFAIELLDSNRSINEFNAAFIESESIELLNTINISGKSLILKTDLAVANAIDLSVVDYLLITGEGDIQNKDLETLKELSSKIKILLGYGFDASNIHEMLNKSGAHGIAITAGDEIRPGYKDYDELADILEALETDEWA